MSVVLYVLTASGIGLLISFLLFKAERAKGRRFFLRSWRDRIDSALERRTASFLGVKRILGASSLRLFFHYLLHQALSAILFVVRFTESILHRLRTKNKVVAKVIKEKSEEGHLARIAKHKDATALTDEEREKLKERSLRD